MQSCRKPSHRRAGAQGLLPVAANERGDLCLYFFPALVFLDLLSDQLLLWLL